MCAPSLSVSHPIIITVSSTHSSSFHTTTTTTWPPRGTANPAVDNPVIVIRDVYTHHKCLYNNTWRIYIYEISLCFLDTEKWWEWWDRQEREKKINFPPQKISEIRLCLGLANEKKYNDKSKEHNNGWWFSENDTNMHCAVETDILCRTTIHTIYCILLFIRARLGANNGSSVAFIAPGRVII